ncbi:MAG: hypothetical protein DMF93_19850 [Acidobacteria bacterium]|nr:MAG: hypothetical protein DMF93_19850 [Acidobacteriota bacterium]
MGAGSDRQGREGGKGREAQRTHRRYDTHAMTGPILLAAAIAAQAATPSKVDIVSVTGCLKEASANTWTLTAATDPVPSSANAPAAKDIPKTPPAGRNEFRLIGVSEFNLPAHKDRTVIVKGLYIKATPVSRLNITSVTDVAASCVAPK